MSTYIKGGFRDNKERLVTIEIKSPYGVKDYDLNQEASPVKIAFDSIEIEYDIDDMFETIIKKRMSLNLITEIYLGDVLFSSKSKEVTVEVKREGEVLFSGYVEPYTYSQSFANVKEEFTLNCIDDLSCLEYEYLTDHTSWKDLVSQTSNISFKEYLSIILPTSTYYDMSKKVYNKSVFESCGIAMKIFLGDSEDDIMSNEEVLDEILKYFNLHIIQQGKDLYIFDWNTIKKSDYVVFTNIFDSTQKTLNLTKKEVTRDKYNDDSTNISISDVYNQIELKCKLDTIDSLIDDPLDSDNLQYYSNYKQLWFSEYISSGEGSSAHNAYRNIVRQGYENQNTINESYDAWCRNDWYFKLAYNPQWKLMYNGRNVEEWIERDANNNPINLHRVLETMKNYRFFPMLISCGKNEDRLDRNNKSRLTSDGGVKGKITLDNYICISVNGSLDDSTEEFNRIQSDICKASGFNQTDDSCKGLLVYEGTSSGQYSPSDPETKNYLVFQGSMVLNPVRYISGWGGFPFWYANSSYRNSAPDITFKEVYDNIDNWQYTVGVTDNDDGGIYCHQFWTSQTPGSLEVSAPTKNMIYPFTDEAKAQELEYNYSAHWSDEDTYDKLPVLECELKIGDKYLVETYQGGNKQKPLYGWYTKENLPTVEGYKRSTFTLGFDPEIGKKIVGKEYEITNTVNGKVSDEKGMAVPITYNDALSGKISFKILGVVNGIWNEISRRHPTLFRSTKYYDNYKNILSHVSSIWVKNFGIQIISDNQGSDVPSNKQDLVYISDEEHGVIKKRDDLENKICTMPSTQELLERGIDTNVAENTCVNLNTNRPLDYITDLTQNEYQRPEHLYIDQYWNIYHKPRVVIETNLDDSMRSQLQMINFSIFGDTIPLKETYNLRRCEVEITTQQIQDK